MKQDQEKIVIIASGGMDSTTLLYDTIRTYGSENVVVLSFNYGSKHNAFELPKISLTCKKLQVEQKIIDLVNVFQNFKSHLLLGGESIPEGHYAQENMKQTIVPFRNGILLSIAAGYAETIKAKKIIYGAHLGDFFVYEDCRPEFISAFSSAVSLGTMNKISIEAPYSNINKGGILEKGLKLGVDYSLTHTCYNPNERGEACGRCGACCERLEAFDKNGVEDPLVYQDREFYKTVTS